MNEYGATAAGGDVEFVDRNCSSTPEYALKLPRCHDPTPRTLKFMASHNPSVTIAIIPREQNSVALRALDQLLNVTDGLSELIYVGSRLSRRMWARIEQRTRKHDVTFIPLRSGTHLSANAARQWVLQHASGDFIAFVDNDVLVDEGWLPSLMDCALASGATAIVPLVMERIGTLERVHLAGGSLSISAAREIQTTMQDYSRERSCVLREKTAWEFTQLVEFHCILVCREHALAADLFDAKVAAAWEHIDFCLAVRKAGGQLCFDPHSSVTYVVPGFATQLDLTRFRFQWDVHRHRQGMAHFCRKWSVKDNYPSELLYHRHRRHIFYPSLANRYSPSLKRILPRPLFEILKSLHTASRTLFAGVRRWTESG